MLLCVWVLGLLKWVPYLGEHDTRDTAQVMEKEKTRQALTLYRRVTGFTAHITDPRPLRTQPTPEV